MGLRGPERDTQKKGAKKYFGPKKSGHNGKVKAAAVSTEKLNITPFMTYNWLNILLQDFVVENAILYLLN